MPATSSILAMFWRVWEATCPTLSPVANARAPLRRASASAMRTMRRRYTTTRAGGGTLITTSRWISPNGTRSRSARYCQAVRRSTSARAFSCDVGGRYGTLWKWTKSTRQPRFIMRHAATGESIPPDSNAATVPLAPTGSPPGPAMRSRYTNVSAGRTSTWMVRAGWVRSTRVRTRSSTKAPRAVLISTLDSG